MSRKHLFSDRVGRILPSATLEMTAKAAELKRLKKPVYNMSVGEPDFPTPENIQQAGIYAIKNGITKYTPGAGTHNLKSAIQKKLQRDNNLTYDLNEIVEYYKLYSDLMKYWINLFPNFKKQIKGFIGISSAPEFHGHSVESIE